MYMTIDLNLSKGKCAYCGKEIPIRNNRDKSPQYCSRAHASMSRYKTRYKGSLAGPKDRPDMKKKERF